MGLTKGVGRDIGLVLWAFVSLHHSLLYGTVTMTRFAVHGLRRDLRFAARFAAPQNARVVTMPPPPQNTGGLPRRRSGYNKSGAARNETSWRSHHIFLNRLHSWKIINISKIYACKHYYKNLKFILALSPDRGFLGAFYKTIPHVFKFLCSSAQSKIVFCYFCLK